MALEQELHDDLEKCPECGAYGDWEVERYDFEDQNGAEGSCWIYECGKCGFNWAD